MFAINVRLVRCVRIIESAWIVYRNRRIFRLLKHAIRAAVGIFTFHYKTFELLLKIRWTMYHQ